MNSGLHHIEIYVFDLERSTEFWKWFLEELGYSLFQEWNKGKSWKLGEHYIVFVQAEEKYLEAGYNRKRVGLNHLAFFVSSSEQFKEITEKLKNKGIAFLYKDKSIDNAIYFEDPDRIKVELTIKK